MSMQSTATHYRFEPLNIGRILVWVGFALCLLLAPQVFRSSLSVSMLSQMGYLVIICLSFNILLGQGGMLSFGHAVYSGLGAFVAVHTMNYAASKNGIYVPLPLIPLIGGFGALFFSALLGFVTTKKSGTTFAMITLGIGEMVASMSLMFPGFFGGDGGVSTNRVYGAKLPFGISFGPQIQVYYLIAFYCFICTALMFAFTRTPLGRMLNAVRDNPERVQFVGYNTQRVRFYAFMVSAFFAGIGGALATINFEIVSASDSLGAVRSGGYLLFTFLGGATFFFGPMIGGVLLVLASVLLSEFTKAWLLYLGLAFLLMVMYAPGGVASLIMMNVRLARYRQLRPLGPAYLALFGTGLVMLAGASACIEMIYHFQLDAAMGPKLHFLGLTLDSSSPLTWAAALAVLAVGAAIFTVACRRFARRWDKAQEAVELALVRSGKAGAA